MAFLACGGDNVSNFFAECYHDARRNAHRSLLRYEQARNRKCAALRQAGLLPEGDRRQTEKLGSKELPLWPG
jgi:hypothetical protein